MLLRRLSSVDDDAVGVAADLNLHSAIVIRAWFVVEIIEPTPGRIVDQPFDGFVFQNGTDQQRSTPQELIVHIPSAFVGRKFHEQSSNYGRAVDVRFVHQRVQVGKKAVTFEQYATSHGRKFWSKTGRILVNSADDVVISAERIKGAQLSPTTTKRFGGVEHKAAYVRADHVEAEQIVFQHAHYGPVELFPVGLIVTEPVERVTRGAEKIRSGQNERSLVRLELLQRFSSCDAHRVSVQAVQVVMHACVHFRLHAHRLAVQTGNVEIFHPWNVFGPIEAVVSTMLSV
ncbi:hypothetical protein T09_5449 [Trichinella sp. T9]|uniref:Uncharacterized protein n=1 Tax=Trichinella murrelli TaxID=144512 RepID=A0A0V0U9A9_9BILA|nr:hypothetical protein T05_7822 [Trichinella murrelli]KRX62480.1 hypothetical protein T09_5449 [Trichinella sp. T9]KRZ96262.1 hypothetical protein T08_11457 [Trichinella sp. T8]